MTAFTEDQKVKIRKYLGFSKLFASANPLLEGAIGAIEELNDGGAAVNDMTDALTKISTIESQITTAQSVLLAWEVTGEIKVDAARALQALRKEGQTMINTLSFAFGIKPFRRYFYPSDTDSSGDFYLHG
jgi:hypothetical protein